MRFCLSFILAAVAFVSHLHAEEHADQPRTLDRFGIVFIMGYAGDHFPQDKGEFETLIKSVKEAHYNVVLCQYTPWRAEICKKHDVEIMVDLLTPDHHVYKNVEGAKALAESLRESDSVYAYHLWSDRIGGTAAGRSRDAKNVRTWDPHHPVYVGSYNGRALAEVTDADLFGYYDFHWFRGGLWRHLERVSEASKQHHAGFLRYTQGDAGLIGKGNYNRVLYTISVSLAFGMKGYMYHFTGGEIDKSNWQWTQHGEDLARVNAEVAPLGPELMKLGNPLAVYSTPITRTAKDDPIEGDEPTIPPELKAAPDEFWLKVEKGEALYGVFQDAEKRDAILFANHNAYQPQAMQLALPGGAKQIEQFNRKTGKWTTLETTGGAVTFELPAAAAELIRIQR